ncbi:hypothetical protein N7467_006228 [Penicillium canescens]|nr:hypothetical protein N7467_006228 [Penicillium canescens]
MCGRSVSAGWAIVVGEQSFECEGRRRGLFTDRLRQYARDAAGIGQPPPAMMFSMATARRRR